MSKEHPFPDKNIGFAGYRPILNFKTTFTVEGTVPLATSIYRWIFHYKHYKPPWEAPFGDWRHGHSRSERLPMGVSMVPQ